MSSCGLHMQEHMKCTCTHIDTCIHAHREISMYSQRRTHTQCTHTRLYTSMHTETDTHTYTHRCTHTHTHTCPNIETDPHTYTQTQDMGTQKKEQGITKHHLQQCCSHFTGHHELVKTPVPQPQTKILILETSGRA